MKLSQMFENTPKIEIAGLCIDLRYVKANDIYFCMEGMVHDGYEFIDNVIGKGIKCIVHSKPVNDTKEGITYTQMENVNRTLNRVASTLYGHPSRKTKAFGATGINGKSTVASTIRDVYSRFAPCGYIEMIPIGYGGMTLPLSSTTLNAVLTHKTMKDMVEHGIQAVTLGVSLHGLEPRRVQSANLGVTVFNNLAYDRLDFHDTIGHYFGVKKKLFTNLKREGVAVLNADDVYVDQLADAAEVSVVTYSIDNHTTYRAEDTWIEKTELRFTLVHGTERYEVSTDLVTLYNIYNLLGAVTIIAESGIPIEQQLLYLYDIRQIEGRMEHVDEGRLFNAVVDLAHAPDGVEEISEYAKDITEDGHSVIAVFGSAGKRDTKRHRIFSEIASRYYGSIIPIPYTHL